MVSKFVVGLAVAGAALSTVPAQAATFVFSGNTSTYGTLGNSSAPMTVGGITVTATAWSTDALPVSNLPEQAYLGNYGQGLGVTNNNEGFGNTSNSHTIDNVGSYDFIKLTFSAPVKLTGITRAGFDVDNSPSTIDTDAWVSYGSTGFGTTALWQGYLDRGVNAASGTTFSSTNAGTVWLIGAARSAANGDRNDGFKLSSVTAVAAVPEPATWSMMLFGFGAVGVTMRRRRRITARVQLA